MKYLCILIIFLIFLPISINLLFFDLTIDYTLYAQGFDRNFESNKKQYEYKKRGIRKEGRADILVSAPDLELLSMLGYCEELNPDNNADLKIMFYLEKDTTLFITAKELKIREYYIMKPIQSKWKKGWQEFGPWPTSEVLKPLGLSLTEIGIIGRIREKDRIGSGLIAPLIIYHSNLPATIDQYTTYIVPKQSLENVKYKVFLPGEKEAITEGHIIELFGGVPFSINIDLTQQSEGYYKLVLDGKYKNRMGGPQRTYTFYHKPKVK